MGTNGAQAQSLPPPLPKASDAKRSRLIATLVAAGWPDVDVAEQTQTSLRDLTVIKSSPLFQAVVSRLCQDLHERTAIDHVQAIEALVPRAIEVHKQAMDTADEWSDKLRAAGDVLDRTIPRKTDKSTGVEVHIHLEREEREAIETACVEDGTTIAVRAEPPRPAVTQLRTLEEAIEELAQEERR